MKLWIVIAAMVLCSTATAFAAGGTDIVASKGQPAYVSEGWPEGADELVNDPARTTGWNDWFSEWPNDVNQYAMEVQSVEDVNRLIEKLAAVKTDLKQVRLCPLPEPKGLGWVSSVPEGNQIPVMFSIGDQTRMDQWYAHVRKPFGQIEFEACPVAVPPTLTLFVQHPVIDLSKLKIPAGVTVAEGYLPTVFHQPNTKQDREQREKSQPPPMKGQPLPPDVQKAHERIQAFIEKRKSASDNAEGEVPPGPAPVVGNASPVDHLAWDSRSSTLFTTGRFNGLGQWMFTIRGNTNHGELVGCELNQLVRMPNHANSMAVGGRPTLIVTGTNVGTVEVREGSSLQTKQTCKVGPESSVYAVAVDPQGQQVAACRTDGTVLVWKVGEDKPSHQLKKASREGERMSALAFSPDGKSLATLSRYGYLALWDLTKGEPLGSPIDPAGGEQSKLQFTPSGDRLVVVDRAAIRFWHPLQEPKLREVIPPEAVCPRYPKKDDTLPDGRGTRPDFGHDIRFAGVMALSPDAKRVASITETGGLAIWEIESLKVLATFPPPEFVKAWEHPGMSFERIAYSPDAKYVAASAHSGGLAVWQVE